LAAAAKHIDDFTAKTYRSDAKSADVSINRSLRPLHLCGEMFAIDGTVRLRSQDQRRSESDSLRK
jgi:hypothetical protein